MMEDFLINKRVCPMPMKWNEIYSMLQQKSDVKISAPLILAAWHHTSDEEKRDRFKYHLQQSEKLGVLDKIADFLNQIDESEWHHEYE